MPALTHLASSTGVPASRYLHLSNAHIRRSFTSRSMWSKSSGRCLGLLKADNSTQHQPPHHAFTAWCKHTAAHTSEAIVNKSVEYDESPVSFCLEGQALKVPKRGLIHHYHINRERPVRSTDITCYHSEAVRYSTSNVAEGKYVSRKRIVLRRAIQRRAKSFHSRPTMRNLMRKMIQSAENDTLDGRRLSDRGSDLGRAHGLGRRTR